MATTNIMTNRINEIVPPASILLINTNADGIKQALPFEGEFALTDAERATQLSMNVNNRVFVTDVMTEMGISGGVLPPFVLVTNVQRDATLFDQLDAIESRLMNILQVVRDLKRMAAHEAYATALAVYKMYEMAAAAGVPGAQESYNRLRERFDAQGQGGGAEEQPEA